MGVDKHERHYDHPLYFTFIEVSRAGLWFRPALWMLACGALAAGLVASDRWLEAHVDTRAIPLVLRSNPDDARALLGAIVTAMLTVVSLAFSVVMLAVVQMSNAFSPRLVRLYMGDAYNQHVLGLLLGTFLYSLLVLRSVNAAAAAPVLATNAGVLLAVVATIALVAFLHHIPRSIKVDAIIRMILEGCERELERGFPSKIGQPCAAPEQAELDQFGDPRPLVVHQTGYMQFFDLAPLADRERERPAVVQMDWQMGDFILAGTVLGRVWGEFDERDQAAFERACVIGSERTLFQDHRFGIEQLTDVALRALSPSTNDPTTATDVCNALTELFARLLARQQVSLWRRDDDGLLRVGFRLAPFNELIELSYVRVLSYGGGDQNVVRCLITNCRQLANATDELEHRRVLYDLLLDIHAVADDRISLAAFRRTLDAEFERACVEFDRPPLPRLSADSEVSRRAAAAATRPPTRSR